MVQTSDGNKVEFTMYLHSPMSEDGKINGKYSNRICTCLGLQQHAGEQCSQMSVCDVKRYD